jgi:hypothetical protein
MPTVADISVGVEDYGVTVLVPNDDVARLMYYLNCVTQGVGLDILQDDLLQYKNYRLLNPARIAVVFKTAVELSPDLFVGKVLFRDDEGEYTKSTRNAFISITAGCDVVSLQSDFVIAGRVQNVTKVMFFKSSWLKQFYTDPLERIASSKATRSVPSRNPPPRTRTEQTTPHDPPPPPYTETNGQNTHSTTFFYLTMSVTQLKAFLKGRGVEFGDVFDKESLCRRAWETHCDCMTIVELNSFLSDRNISTVGCRDINSRRQRLKMHSSHPQGPHGLQRLLIHPPFGLVKTIWWF